jgi:hypothetical protein
MGRLTLLGVCGLYCGACYHYRASFPEGTHLLEEAARQGSGLKGYTCQGCRSDRLYIHAGCAECQIRACAESKGILHCGLCTEFVCARIRSFRNDGRPHHQDILSQLEELKTKGAEQWLAQQRRRWKCGCGTSVSGYEEFCSNCGVWLSSYAPDPRVRSKAQISTAS